MLADSQFVGFIPVTNLTSAKEFFVNILGLTFIHEDDHALVVDANGTTLRLTLVAGLHPQPFTVAGWSSNDVASTLGRMSDAEVAFQSFDGLDQDDLGIWHVPGGDLIAWFSDPDGNILSISGHDVHGR